MHPRLPLLAIALMASTLAACDGEDPQPCSGASCGAPATCDGVTCSGVGACGVVAGQAHCLCMPGYHAVGLTCVADAGFAGSCTWASEATCRDFTGSAYYEAFVRSSCGSQGVYSASRCVTTGAVGRCIFQSGAGAETVTYYFPPNTVSSGQAACTYGSWSSP
jgi:hypothetical protein